MISPHIARKLVGPKHKVLIPTAALISIFIFLVSDDIAKNLLAPIEIPKGNIEDKIVLFQKAEKDLIGSINKLFVEIKRESV